MKKKKVVIVTIIAIFLIIITIGLLIFYKLEIFKNLKYSINNLVTSAELNVQDVNITVDITNIENDNYPEHEHVWFEEYDETNHWKKCSVCKEVKDFAEHTLTTTWALGYESCREGNLYTTICSGCGYGETGKKTHTWNGKWVPNCAPDYHNRICASCGGEIGANTYIDNVNGGILVPESFNEMYYTGMVPDHMRCKLSDGSYRECGTSEKCSICGGPWGGSSSKHTYYAYINNPEKTIKCTHCGKERRNI